MSIDQVSDLPPRVQYVASAAQTVFPYPFPIFADGDLDVYIDGVLKAVNTDYTVTGEGDDLGGNVTFTAPLVGGEIVTIIRNIAFERDTDVSQNGPWSSTAYNDELDKVFLILQQLKADFKRSLRIPSIAEVDDDEIELTVANFANKYLTFDADGKPTPAVLSSTTLTQAILGQLLYPRNLDEIATFMFPVNYASPWQNVLRFGAVGDATTDCTAAISNTLTALNGRGAVTVPKGVYRTLSTITLATGQSLVGEGASEVDNDNAAARGASCILRDFAGTTPTIDVPGDDAAIDGIDIDNSDLGTGDCVRIWGSRFRGGKFSTRNSGGVGCRLGRTNAGASSTNTNCFNIDYLLTTGNASHGALLDDTNTTTSLSYPLGISNCNSGRIGIIDAHHNGGDGLRIANANDNVVGVAHCESNAGCGVRFFTDGTNAGPRCNTIQSNDCEANTGNDVQIDAATLPAAAPGLYNKVYGNRSVAVSSRIVDNSSGSLVIQWLPGLFQRGYHFGPWLNVLNTSGNAGFNAHVGANFSPVSFYGIASGTVDSIARISVHKNGGSQTDGFEINQFAVTKPLNNLFPVTYSASMTIDARTGNIFQISANNGTAFTINAPTNPQDGTFATVQIRNVSGGALGAVTWNAVFKMSAWTQPANGFSRSITFFYNGANWIQESQTGVDVPN